MLHVTPGSHAYKIIMLLLITGEFPFRSLGLLGNERMTKATAVRMTQVHEIRVKDQEKTYRCKLITISGKSTLKTMRLCRSSFEMIATVMPELLNSYMVETYGHRFHGQNRIIERSHRIAEVQLVCMRAGIECRPHILPVLQKQERRVLSFDDPAFFTSRSIKRVGVDEMNKTKYIRMVGAIFSRAGLYEIYNTRSEVLKWYGQGEDKIIQTMTDVCRYNFQIPDSHRAIIMGQSYEAALQMLRRFESGDKYVQLDYLGYMSMHYLPMDSGGIQMLQIMMIPDWQHRLIRLIFEEQNIPAVKQFEYDAQIDGAYVLSFLDGDLLKLASFHKTVIQQNLRWEVACFDTQVSFLHKYLGDNAIINSVPLELIHDHLKAERRSLI